MGADLTLKQLRGFWETPPNIAILTIAIPAVMRLLAGVTGYQIARSPPPVPTTIIEMPS